MALFDVLYSLNVGPQLISVQLSACCVLGFGILLYFFPSGHGNEFCNLIGS